MKAHPLGARAAASPTGTLAPGHSPGTSDIVGNYTQLAGGVLELEIGGLLAGTSYDVLHVTGSAALDGHLRIDLIDLGAGRFGPRAGDTFDVVLAEDLRGAFSGLALPALGPGLLWQFDWLADEIGSIDVGRLRVQAVPLPPVAWLLGSALVGLAVAGRRPRRRRE